MGQGWLHRNRRRTRILAFSHSPSVEAALQAEMCIRDSTYGVYPEEIDGLKRDYEKLWGEVSKVLRELSELVAK